MPRPKMYCMRKRAVAQAIVSVAVILSVSGGLVDPASTLAALVVTIGALGIQRQAGAGVWRLAHQQYPRFHLDGLDPTVCKLKTNFTKDEIRHLLHSLSVPPMFRDVNGCVYSGEEAFCLLLYRLTYPVRLCDLVEHFGLSEPQMSLLLDLVSDWFLSRHGHLISNVSIWSDLLPTFANRIYDRQNAYKNCFGFIDGTIRGIARPKRGQRLCYSGHKRKHGLKYQSIALPNGLIGYCWGPILGRRHDCTMLYQSGLQNQLATLMQHVGASFCVYGDPAYPLTVYFQRAFVNPAAGSHEEDFNRRMSSVRIVVEWSFGIVTTLWTWVDLKRRQQLWLFPVARYYLCAVLLTNFHTCVRGGNNISYYFRLPPPALDEYIGLQGIPDFPVTPFNAADAPM